MTMNNLRRLRCFMAAAEGQSFGRAADKMHIARPAFSRQIAQLEEELGVSLFDRTGRSATLSQAGRIYARQIEEVLSKLDIANANIANFSRSRRHLVRMGVPDFFGPEERILNLIRNVKSHPKGIELAVFPMNSSDQIRAIETGEIDLGLYYKWPDLHDMRGTRKLFDDEYVIAMSANHPLADRRNIAIADIRDENFVSVAPELSSGYFRKLMVACGERDFVPRIAQFAPSMSGLYTLIAAGAGISFVVAESRPPPSVVQKRLRDLSVRISVDLVWRPGEMRRSVKTVIDVLSKSHQHA
jgi:DNA-binding transcriptional LysR family regulator